MEGTHLSFSDLKPGRSIQPVVARLLRFWEARNVKKGGELMGVDMLLLDAKSTLMQGTISVHRLNTFKHLLNEGSMYALSGFDVSRSNPRYKFCDSNISIRFTDFTSFVEVHQSVNLIPTEMFMFRNHAELVALANTNSELPDVVGEVSTIKIMLNDQTQTTHRIMTHIQLANGATVCISVFDGLAVHLHHKLQLSDVEPRVIVATNINLRLVGGRLYLNATSGTHFYFDDETNATKSLCTEIRDKEGGESKSVSKYRGVQKIEAITLAELNEFIYKSAPQAIDFLCIAKVTEIETKNGWCYISCSKCSKKLQRGISSFTCISCHDSEAVGVLRYRLELDVSDSGDKAVFVAFDTYVTKLTNIRASDVAHLGGLGVEANPSNELPQFLTDIVGKTYTFHLKLFEYNFTSKHQSFTISRIFDGPKDLPTPTFLNQDDDNDDNTPGDNMLGITTLTSKDSCCTKITTTHPTDGNENAQRTDNIIGNTTLTAEASTSNNNTNEPTLTTEEQMPKKPRMN